MLDFNEEHELVIMLDDWLEVYPDQWPISARSKSIEEIRRTGQHDGEPELVPRSEHNAVLLENKSLKDSRTGRVDHGGIYMLLSGDGSLMFSE